MCGLPGLLSCPGRGEETLKLCVNLCCGWIFAEGARLLGAEAEWDSLLHATFAPAVSSPRLFSGEEELFDVDALTQCFHEGDLLEAQNLHWGAHGGALFGSIPAGARATASVRKPGPVSGEA